MGGRRAGRKAALSGGFVEPRDGQTVMRVLALRGSNLLEVEDEKHDKTLCMIPAKFNKRLWIKRGNYVLVEEGDRQKTLEDNCKVTGTVVEVLYNEQVRELKKAQLWPEGFEQEDQRSSPVQQDTFVQRTETSSLASSAENIDEDNDGLPPLEQNNNRPSLTYFSSSEGEESD